MPGERGKRITAAKYGEIVSLLRQGKKQADVAKLTDVHVNTVQRFASDPVLSKDLKQIREDVKKVQLVRGAKLQEKAWDLVEAQTGSKGDPRGFKDAMQGMQALEQVTAGASGETQRVEVGGHVNVDVRAILAQVFGPQQAPVQIPRVAKEIV